MSETKPTTLEQATPAKHNDNEKSSMPERGDEQRDQAPHDNPGKQPGEGEPQVG
jgi:hypothetical protein